MASSQESSQSINFKNVRKGVSTDQAEEVEFGVNIPHNRWTVSSISPSETINGITLSYTLEYGANGIYIGYVRIEGTGTKIDTITWVVVLESTLGPRKYEHTITCTLDILAPWVTSIEISGPSSIQVGNIATYSARVLPTDAYDTDVSAWSVSGWDSSNNKILKLVSSSGSTATVQALIAGEGYIEALTSGKIGSDDDYPENNFANSFKKLTVTEPPKYTYYARLYYNANGGSGAPSSQSDSIYAESASGYATFTISSTKPTKQGFIFLGWSTSSSATSPSYQPGSTITVYYDSSKTLYAVWQKESIGKAKIDGDWKDVSNGYVKVDGVWKIIDSTYMKVDGTWKKGS